MSGLTGWLASLTEEQRERVVAEMRRLGEESLAHMAEAQRCERNGVLPVGPAHFDRLLKSVVFDAFLRALRAGSTPTEAAVVAKALARESIAKHNARRSRDRQWQRWDGAGDDVAERLRETFTRAAT